MGRLLSKLSFLMIIAALGCNTYTSKQKNGSNDNGVDASQPGFTIPTFAFVSAQVFQPYCLSCHSAVGGNRAGVNLETFQAVTSNINAIQAVAVAAQIMPPPTGLPSFPKSILKQWIAGGAPQDGVVSNPTAPVPSASPTPPPSIPLQPTYTSLAAHIFTPKCLTCHAPTKPLSSLPLDTYDNVIKTGAVVAGNPAGSHLFTITSSGQMPPGNPLSADEVQAINTWITNGAQNN